MSTLQDRYDYVVVGAGMAAANALKGIRKVDPDGSVAVLGAEADPPLYRPDLSKTLWLEEGKTVEGSGLVEGDASDLLHLSTTVTAIDTDAHTVTLEDGTVVGYGKLLLATGAAPRTIEPGPGPRVFYYRTADDFRRLRSVAAPGTHVAVVGDGYIGSELAAALVRNDVTVSLVTPEELILTRLFPEGLARHVTEGFTERGVTLVHGMLAGGEETADGVTLRLEDGTEIQADAAVIGVGVVPSTGLAEAAGIEVDNGIVVDDHLRTSAPDVWAAGDVASYPDKLLGRRRVEHAQAANSQGSTAGRAMAGADVAYERTPFFWSDLFDDGYEAVGEVTTRLRTVEDWGDDDYGSGVVYYLDDAGAVRGVLLWNTWDSVPRATELIDRTRTEPVTDDGSLTGQIPPG